MHLLGKAMDAAFWQGVREKDIYRTYREELLKLYAEHCENDEIYDLKYSEYKLYWQTGNRSVYERKFFDRRLARSASALLSLI